MSLVNKIPSIKIGLWKTDNQIKNSLLTELPEDVEIAEKYIFGYTRFIYPGSFLYSRINIFYNSRTTSVHEIESVISGF